MTLDQYTTALQSHDWFYEYSDDHSVWKAGRDVRQQLRAAQRTLDPRGTLWNQYAPKECRLAIN